MNLCVLKGGWFRANFRKPVSGVSCFLLVSVLSFEDPAASASYYVSATTGDDARTALQAKNNDTPWKTINRASQALQAGDTCIISGGIYREVAVVANSGTLSEPINFRTRVDSNGDPEVVTICGVDRVAGWVQESPNVWYVPWINSLGDGNQVFQNGEMMPEARWPNAGATYPWQDSSLEHPTHDELGDWSYANSAGYDVNGQNGWFADPQLPSRSDGYWNGATVHIMAGHGWIMKFPVVTDYIDASKKLTTDDASGDNSNYAIVAGNEFYLTGKKGEMDSQGEWFHDAALGRLYFYSAAAPSNVEVKKRNYGFDISGRAYVNFENLGFFGCTVKTDSGSINTSFDGLSMRYLGHNRKAASPSGLILRSGSTLRNSELAWDSCNLVQLEGSDIRVVNNHLHDSSYVPGWRAMVDGHGYRNLVAYNTMHGSGRAVMRAVGRAAVIEYNDMYDAMRMTSDGAVFYTFLEAGNTVFRYNLLHDSPGPKGHTGAKIQGFYLDSQHSNWIVHHNVIWGFPGYAMQFNARQNFDMVFNNTCRNALAGGISTYAAQDGETGSRIYNNLFNAAPSGDSTTWQLTDFQHNLYTDPGFVLGSFQLQPDSPAIDQGVVIPGVTDGYAGAAPDIGALEHGGGFDWTMTVGRRTTPPDPDPVYNMPAMVFANKVQDGSFESRNLSSWVIAPGGNVILFKESGQTAWTDIRWRTGAYSLRFGQGNSEVAQTVTDLQPAHRYTMYVGVQTADSSAAITMGVRNHGNAVLEKTLPAGSGEWEMNTVSFITGATDTSAQIYVKVNSSSTTLPVYVDDLGVELAPENTELFPNGIPLVAYPFSESSGLVAHDATTNANDATLVSMDPAASWANGAIQFSSSGYVQGASLDAVPWPSGSFSVAFRVKFDNTGFGTPRLAANNGGWLKKGWYIVASQNRNVGMYLWTNDDPAAEEALSLWPGYGSAPGVWAHLVYTVDRERGIFSRYRNGRIDASIVIPDEFGDIGTLSGVKIGSPTFDGQMDDFQLWEYSLSEGEAAAVASDPDGAPTF